MRRVIKYVNSLAIENNLTYKVKGDNSELRTILLNEQNKFCAYTETYIGISDNAHLDHFNPTLKNTEEDNYNNWFMVKAQWNLNKPKKWLNEPILHPTDEDFETRIIYSEGDYFLSNNDDQEARNLIKLIDLDNPTLAEERKNYIKTANELIDSSNMSPKEYFQIFAKSDRNSLRFVRAIKEEFEVDIIGLLEEFDN